MNTASFESAIAGFIASTSAGIFFPLEVIKVHLMIADGRSKNFTPHYRHSFQVLKSLYDSGGIWRLYQGWYLSVANSLSWGIYFYFYQLGKEVLHDGPLDTNHHELQKFAIAFQAAIMTTVIVNPVMVVKTRIMLLKYHQSWHQDIKDSVAKVIKLDGFRGFFSGIVPALFLSLNGTLHMYFYETLKENFNPKNENLRTTLIGACSKVLSSMLLHPFQTIKYRLQQEQHSSFILKRSSEIKGKTQERRIFDGVKECVLSTYQHEGVKGFYRGLVINQIRLFPANGLFFLVYENVLKFLQVNNR